jgi:hypothetical protein
LDAIKSNPEKKLSPGVINAGNINTNEYKDVD